MIGLLALLPAAQGYTLECAGAPLVAAVPPPNAVDVPLDVRLAFAYGEGCHDVGNPLSVELIDLSNMNRVEEVAEGSVWRGDHDLSVLKPGAPLEPSTDHTTSLLDLAFRTGEQLAPTLSGEISGEVVSATWERRDDLARFEARIVPVPDPSALSVIELVDPADPDVILGGAIVGDADEVVAIATWTMTERPDALCLEAIHRDAAGRQVGEALALCGDGDGAGGGGGCSTSPSPPWLALLSLLFFRRSR